MGNCGGDKWEEASDGGELNIKTCEHMDRSCDKEAENEDFKRESESAGGAGENCWKKESK